MRFLLYSFQLVHCIKFYYQFFLLQLKVRLKLKIKEKWSELFDHRKARGATILKVNPNCLVFLFPSSKMKFWLNWVLSLFLGSFSVCHERVDIKPEDWMILKCTGHWKQIWLIELGYVAFISDKITMISIYLQWSIYFTTFVGLILISSI